MRVITEPPRAEWSEFLERVDGANIFQSPEMATVIDGTIGCKSVVVACEEGGEIQALMAGSLVSYRPSFVPLVTTRAIITGGPLGCEAHAPALVAAFDRKVESHALLTQIRNLRPPSQGDHFFLHGYRWSDHTNYIIDLARDEQVMLRAMAKGRRRNIQQAERGHLELVELGLDETEAAYMLLRETYSRARIPLSNISLFLRAMEILAPKGMLWAFGVKSEGVLCAAIFLLRWKETIFNWYNASSSVAWEMHANEWLLWRCIRRAALAGYTRFDLGGGGGTNDFYGPGEFKKHFGGMRTNPGRLERLYHPIAFWAANAAYRVWRSLP